MTEMQDFYHSTMTDKTKGSRITDLHTKVPLPSRESGLIDARQLVFGASGSLSQIPLIKAEDNDGLEWDGIMDDSRGQAMEPMVSIRGI